MVKRREKSEKTSMLDRQIAQTAKDIKHYKALEGRYAVKYVKDRNAFGKAMIFTMKAAVEEKCELLLLLCELKIRRGVRRHGREDKD